MALLDGEGKNKPHAVCIPLPYQGHINPMLKVAKLLNSRGFHITFVNTEFNHQKILRSRGPDSLNGWPDFQFDTITDGLPPCDLDSTQDLIALHISLEATTLVSVRNLISKLNNRTSSPQVTCITADGVMTSPLEAAQELGIPGVMFWAMSSPSLIANLQCGKLVEHGVLPLVKDTSDLEMVIDFIPGLSHVRVKDLPDYILRWDDARNNPVAVQLKRVSKASAIIFNTFDALDVEVLDAMKPLLPPIYTLGPLQLMVSQQETLSSSNRELNSIGSNLWKEDDLCLTWLDSKQPKSVIYVSFGSLAALTKEEVIEFAWGLANSNHPFLWILGADLVMREAAVLPPEFTKETADRGFIADWCPQEQVLRHSSIALYLTHCGWNSTLDALINGVPLLSWPFDSADQQVNSRYACLQWGISMEIDKVVNRDNIVKLVREMINGENGRLVKKSAMKWMKISHDSIKLGGSSYLNLDKIIEEVLLEKERD